MAQKYKVYLNSHLIILLFSKDFYNLNDICDNAIKDPNNDELKVIVDYLFEKETSERLDIHSEDLNSLWKNFQSVFDVVHAGGGLVENKQGEFLFIFRNGTWDLPKGKLEIGESIESCSVREVEEECGIHHLIIDEKITNTYHFYKYEESIVLKFSHWYKMSYSGIEKLVPQEEEGITLAEWISPVDFDNVKSNTYQNIIEVLKYIDK